MVESLGNDFGLIPKRSNLHQICTKNKNRIFLKGDKVYWLNPYGSETWFTGFEHEGSNYEDKKRDKRNAPLEVMPSDQQLLCRKNSSETQGEDSDAMRPKDKKRSYLESDKSSLNLSKSVPHQKALLWLLEKKI